jgi:hypothetical protein
MIGNSLGALGGVAESPRGIDHEAKQGLYELRVA